MEAMKQRGKLEGWQLYIHMPVLSEGGLLLLTAFHFARRLSRVLEYGLGGGVFNLTY
jgi:hypothetical protein